ncbi:MAG: hypothetical protein RRA94_02785 [Bacteroidota bacterium]|nr:hypothetical protein [Bacteroidota bacterium]
MSVAAKTPSRTWLPVILIIVGALLLFGNLQLFAFGWIFGMLLDFWPLIIVAMGVSRIVAGKSQDFAGGLQLIAVGLLLQFAVFGWMPGNLLSYWPYAFVVVGLWLIFIQPKNKRIEKVLSGSRLQLREILRDAHYVFSSDGFEGGSIFSLLSRVECDLSGCSEQGSAMRMTMRVRWSAVTLYVPDAWRVTFSMRSGLGEAQDHRVLGNPPDGSAAPELHISGTVLGSRLQIRDGEELTAGEKEGGAE